MGKKVEINEKSVAKPNWFYEFIVWLTSLGCRFVFHSIKYYFPNEKKIIELSHPVVACANHIDERDVPLLASIHNFLTPRSKYSLPVRRDMMEKNFFKKEFKAKGILKYILYFIDFTNIVPILFKKVGAIPIARPFRDDTKELLKSGRLRDIVNEQWEDLLSGIRKGNKLFLFPEGTLTNDGYIGPIRKGVFFLQSQIEELNIFPMTLTYDYLSQKKPIAHVGFGNTFRLKKNLTENEVANEIKTRISLTFTVTPANLFSFAMMTDDVRSGVGRHFLFYKLKKLADEVERKNLAYVSKDLLTKSYDELFAEILSNAKHLGFIILLENKIYKGADKLYSEDLQESAKRKLRKINPYKYHANQLRSIHEEMLKIWKEIEVYD